MAFENSSNRDALILEIENLTRSLRKRNERIKELEAGNMDQPLDKQMENVANKYYRQGLRAYKKITDEEVKELRQAMSSFQLQIVEKLSAEFANSYAKSNENT